MQVDAIASAVVLVIKAALAPLAARLAACEARELIPGPAGADGKDGRDGAPGERGADGLGFEDMSASFDGARTLTLTFARGEHVKAIPVELAGLPRICGTFEPGAVYQPGDIVTHGGSAWRCCAPTSTPPIDNNGDVWRIFVRRGRDGKRAS
jgi:integrin beta 3